MNKIATVGELIEALKAFDPSLPVLVDGYEGGMREPYPPRQVMARDGGKDAHGLFGAWELSKDVRRLELYGAETAVVYLSRFEE